MLLGLESTDTDKFLESPPHSLSIILSNMPWLTLTRCWIAKERLGLRIFVNYLGIWTFSFIFASSIMGQLFQQQKINPIKAELI